VCWRVSVRFMATSIGQNSPPGCEPLHIPNGENALPGQPTMHRIGGT
jgi:hypothetical protein